VKLTQLISLNVLGWLIALTTNALLSACADDATWLPTAHANPRTYTVNPTVPKCSTLDQADGEWNIFDPHIVQDARGNAIAVWEAFDGVRYKIWANRCTAGVGWRSPVQIEHNDLGDAYFPRVAIDAAGNATVVWEQSNGRYSSIWFNRYRVDTGWDTASLVNNDRLGNAYAPQIALDAKSNAMVVWQQFDGKQAHIFTNRYQLGSGWGRAIAIDTGSGYAAAPQLACDTRGNAMVVWHANDGQRTSIWANHFDSMHGWAKALSIESKRTGNAYNPQISFQPDGTAVAAWQQLNGLHTQAWVRHYKTPTGWSRALRAATTSTNDSATN
jgi:uncharacterized protein YbdZ (MbtH family)